MKSNELAQIAGVSVRTLRYYHQIGLLQEPARQSNGYRSYDVQHLIRLLRIVQLTSLGMRLSDIPAALDGNGGIKASILDDLDQALAQQIAALERQRQAISSLREGRRPLDMPPELAVALTSLEAGRDAATTKVGREQAVLFGHVFNASERHAMAGLYDRLAGPEFSEIARELGKRFDLLGPGSDDKEISGLAQSYVEYLGPWLLEFQQVVNGSARRDAQTLLWEHATVASNPQQRKMMVQVSERLRHGLMNQNERGSL